MANPPTPASWWFEKRDGKKTHKAEPQQEDAVWSRRGVVHPRTASSKRTNSSSKNGKGSSHTRVANVASSITGIPTRKTSYTANAPVRVPRRVNEARTRRSTSPSGEMSERVDRHRLAVSLRRWRRFVSGVAAVTDQNHPPSRRNALKWISVSVVHQPLRGAKWTRKRSSSVIVVLRLPEGGKTLKRK
jgi:hypothetical protein